MLFSYLIIAFRNLWRNKVFVLTNAMALGIAIAAFIAAYLWVAYDREFDDFHEDEKVTNIYKLHSHWDGGHQNILSPFPLGPTAAADIADIKCFTRYGFEKAHVVSANNGFIEGVGVADSSFFSMFDFPKIDGDLRSFNNQHSVVISKKLSDKLFGDGDPLEKPISVKFGSHEPVNFFVGAVIEDIPHNTSFTFDLMMRIEQYQKIKGIRSNDWGPWPAFSIFFELNESANIANVDLLFQKYIESAQIKHDSYSLEHFKSDFTMTEIWGAMVNVRMWQTPVRMLAIMATLLFMIACFNLSNTSFSLMAKRMKEIGVRRSLGASRKQIILQFLLEICITISLSLVVGLFVADFIVPKFADMWAQGIGNRWDTLTFRIDNINKVKYVITLLVLVIFGVALAGIYPAISFSKLKPVVLFKGDFKVGGTNLFNRSLLVFQFSISLVMLISGLVFIRNSDFMLNKDVGFDKDQIVYLSTNSDIDFRRLQNKVDRISGVEQTTWTNDHFGSASTSKAEINENMIGIRPYTVSEDYLQLMGVQLKLGRELLRSDHHRSVLVTENFAEILNIKNPVGQVLKFWDNSYMIVGVVNDIVDQWRINEGQSNLPLVFVMASPESKPNHLVIRTAPDRAKKVQKQLMKIWDSSYPTIPFQGGMLLEDGPFKTSQDLKSIFIFLTTMTVLLSCLGIYTLASLNVRKRLKEIGIRKILGSTVLQIIKILNHEFLLILLISALIGSFLSHWLLGFIAQSNLSVLFIEVRWELLVGSAVLLVVVGLLTSGMIIAKGANQNPVNNLRDE